MNYKISVIIPVYNVENYIRECLDSVVNQTIGIENIEVIVVNDCTPDNSMDIVEEYAKKYYSIKIVEHEINQGLGPARNTGLKHATAEYISFIDSDDFISENTYEICLYKFERYNCDFVIYEYEYYSESGKKYPRNPSEKLFIKDKLIEDITQNQEIIFSMSTCNRIYSKKFIPLLNFPGTKFEDVLVSTKALFSAKSIYVTNKCKYYYRKRETDNKSIMDDYLNRKESYFDHCRINLELYKYLNEYPQNKALIDWFTARSSIPFLHRMIIEKNFSHNDRKELLNLAKGYLSDISNDTLNKFPSFQKEIIKDVKNKSYWTFFLKYKINYLKIKRLLLLTYQRTLKISEISIIIFISFFYRLNRQNKGIWLFSERAGEAKDNGYRFFEYMRQNHPEIKSYYVIDKNSEEDHNRIKQLGNIIQYKSFKHKIYFVLSEYLISAHRGVIEPWNYVRFIKYFHKLTPQKKYVFLQHGILGNSVRDNLGKKNPSHRIDLFICGAKKEYDDIDGNYGYLPGEVACTGLARYDHLNNIKTKNQILLMPTWRTGIVQPSWIENRIVEDDKFLSSEYYETFQSLINNKSLIEILERNDFNFIFYPHYEIQQYLKYFKSSSDNILIADKDSYDVQTLLKESKLLITDYSSIHFDFAYMNKPLAYYQFDKDSFFGTHYKKGYFSYERDGFGPVLEAEDKIIDFIQNAFNNNFSIEKEYKRKTDEFFVLKDTNNCERIYNEIINLENHYIVVDNLISEIFENHTKKFTVDGLDVYHHNNFLMYVNGSKEKVKDKIFLHVWEEDETLDNVQNYIDLDFFFDDLCVTKDKRSKYKEEDIAIVKLPDIKIREIKTSKTNESKNNSRLPIN